MKKIIMTAIILILLLAGTALGLAYTLLHTQAGANWLLNDLQDRMGGALRLGEADGDLGSGLTIRALEYRDESLEVRAEQVHVAIDLDLLPARVRIEPARIRALEIVQKPNDAPPASLEDTLAALDLPIALELADLVAESVSVTGPDDTSVFAADRVSATAVLDGVLRIDRLVGESEQQSISLQGELGLQRPWRLRATTDLQLQWDEPDNPLPPNTIHVQVDGDLQDALQLQASSGNPSIQVEGSIFDPAGAPRWQLAIESSGLAWPPGPVEDANLSIHDLAVNTEGWVDDFGLVASGQIETPDIERLEFRLTGRGDPAGFEFSELALSGRPVELNATGKLTLAEAVGLDLAATLQRIEPSYWLADWPEDLPLNGAVDIKLAESGLSFNDLRLQAAGSAFNLGGNGRVDLADGRVTADLAWQDFSWPPNTQPAEITSPRGAIRLAGVIDDWTATLDAAVEAPGLPPGNLQAEARGNREQAKLDIVESRVLGGVIGGEAEIRWVDEGRWWANLQSNGIEIGRLLPEWPATVDISLSARGQTEPLAARLDIRHLQGEFRTIPLSARGAIDYRNGVPSFEDFDIELGESRIELNGEIRSTGGIAFRLQAEELASLDQRARGAVRASGRLSLHPDTPHLSLDLEGSGLGWEDLYVESLSIRETGSSFENSVADLEIQAGPALLAQQALDSLTAVLHAGRERQTLLLEIGLPNVNLATAFEGAFASRGADFLQSGWSGQLTSLALTSPDRLSLVLESPAPLEWSPTALKLGTACLSAAAGASMCFEGERVENQRVAARFELNQTPLNLLRPFLDTDLEFTQTIDGELYWAAAPNQPASGRAEFRLSAGELRYLDDFDSLLKTGEGILSFNLEEGRLSGGKLLIPLPGMGEVDFDLNIPDVTSGLDASVNGHLKAAIADMDVITLFFPEIDQAGGRFLADLDLTGEINQPHFSGQLSLTGGLLRHHASGLRLNDINLSGKVLNNDQTTLTGSFRALDGTGNLSGNLDITDILAPRLELAISGENLKLFDAPDLTLVAEPDIRLAWQPGLVEIGGGIRIPSAHIAPNYIPSTTVSESPDLVIVAGKPPVSEQADEEEINISIRGNLDVSLGDDVELELDHARARLTGSANFAWEDALLPIANGQYSLVGQINALGQRLEISQGTIGFPGVPADNPHLNIRAEREIYGNSDIRRAGVFVTGTLRRFVMEPYTEPMTNRERARTLLITGSDFNMEEGVGAVDIGVYIAPKIFVSYGIGVFDNDNVFSVRYDLGKGWGVKATSGQRQTGLDLSYTIER